MAKGTPPQLPLRQAEVVIRVIVGGQVIETVVSGPLVSMPTKGDK